VDAYLMVRRRLCHGNESGTQREPEGVKCHAAATALCHSAVASARNLRRVDREMRWR
jgi:hypothetical protein